MAHIVKIDDKLYDKLKEYCTLNDISLQKFCNDAIVEHLNMEMFGDAPFMVQSVALKANEIDINGRVYTKEALELAVKEYNEKREKPKVEPESLCKQKDTCHNEDGEKALTDILMNNQDPLTEEVKQKTEVEPTVATRPKKRRL